MRLAPILFVILWSSSFVAAKIGLRHISPLLFVAIRLTLCAVVLTALMLILRRSWKPLENKAWLHCGIAGALVNAVSLMAPHVGMMLAPAAQIALVQSLTPILTSVFGITLLHEPVRPRQWLGLILGMTGVGLVVGQAAFTEPARFDGLVLGFVGVLGLVAGTLYFGRFCRGIPALPGATAQFIAAALLSCLCAATLETPRVVWIAPTFAAIAWNTIMVSLGGMALYFAMLTKGSAARASSMFYLVPGTAALFTWAFLGEHLSPLAITGLLVATGGCWLVNTAPRPAT